MTHLNVPVPMCDECGKDAANVTTWKRTQTETAIVKGPARHYCYDCYDALQAPRKINRELKSLVRLAKDLREHAYKYTLEDGQLAADLRQAANYLEAVAND